MEIPEKDVPGSQSDGPLQSALQAGNHGSQCNSLSDQEIQAPIGYDSPPNGGLLAWLQLAGSFFLFFNSWYASAFNSTCGTNNRSSPLLTCIYVEGYYQYFRSLPNLLRDGSQ